jgi:hypothetical protein
MQEARNSSLNAGLENQPLGLDVSPDVESGEARNADYMDKIDFNAVLTRGSRKVWRPTGIGI